MLEQLSGAVRELDIDLLDRGDDYLVVADLPGFEKDEIDLRLRENVLFIHAEHEELEVEEDDSYLRNERENRSVIGSVRLPEEVDEDQVSSRYHNGVLSVTLPKVDPSDSESNRIEID